MKQIYVLLLCGTAVLFSACKKDHGNYDYSVPEVISVEGVEKTYTLISEKDRITLAPKITSTDPKAELDYLWGIYENNPQGYPPALDTIGREKTLDYPIKKAPKDWTLVLKITNKHTGYSRYITSLLTVVTEFTRGWYVAKDDGTDADLDLFLTPASIIPDSKRENIFSTVNGSKVKGRAKLLTYFTNYRTAITGTISPTKTLFLTTDKDVSAIYISTLQQLRNMDNLFIGGSPAKSPNATFAGNSAQFLANDGKLYGLSTVEFNTGIFGAPKMKDDANTPYRLSDYFLYAPRVETMLFDDQSSSFLSILQASASILNSVADEVRPEAPTAMPAANNNKKMLFMGYKSSVFVPAPDMKDKITGYAVFQDKTDPSLKILTRIENFKGKVYLTNDTLETTDMLYHATRYALLVEDENMLYFVSNNQVWSRNLSNQAEKLEFDPPAGEIPTFIRHRKYTEANYDFNYVMIGTKSGDSYKVRMFKKSSGSLSGSPAFVLEGKGMVRDVIYISPSVGPDTNIHSY